MNQQSEQRGNSAGKISPEEREAWSSLYRFYEKYAPQLRAAARLDDDNEEATKVYKATAVEMRNLYNAGGLIVQTLIIPVFDLLDQIFKQAKAQAF